jgi:hypothetical protein
LRCQSDLSCDHCLNPAIQDLNLETSEASRDFQIIFMRPERFVELAARFSSRHRRRPSAIRVHSRRLFSSPRMGNVNASNDPIRRRVARMADPPAGRRRLRLNLGGQAIVKRAG